MTNGASTISLRELAPRRLPWSLSVISALSRSRNSENYSRKPFHMMNDQQTVRKLYKKLLTFYPRGFQEQLGESMEQSFNDLYNERKRHKDRGLFSSVLWIFVETAVGIFKERLLLLIEGEIMQTPRTNLRLASLISLLLVLPFMIMEVVNRRNFNEGFPIPLFTIMWLLPVLFILTGMPILRTVQAGNSILANPVILLIRVVFLILIIWFWSALLIDQMPCFLGVPNCD